MPKLADGFAAELKDRIDLYEVISPYVQLKKSGSSWVGLSPFSQEKTPSFYVHPDKGFFKCFSSGEGGDAISFIQRMENLEFPEALEFLAQRFNVPIRYSSDQNASAGSGVSRSLRGQLHDLHEFASDWFVERLLEKSEEAQATREYWMEDRRFSMDTAAEFAIGYCPVDPRNLATFLSSKNFSDSLLLKSGIFREGKAGRRGNCIFSGRLMIPIRDKIGRVCAFTARKLDQTPEWNDRKSPKYVNSPETAIFEKGNLLFNLHLANKNISEDSEFLLVEGQLDAIRCWSEGFFTAVAPQGTAFTQNQASLLYRSRPKGVVCLLDGDEAGQKAALSYVSIFLKAGLEARFAALPKGTDPDQILQKEGSAGLDKVLKQAKPMIEFVISKKIPTLKNASPKQKASSCEWLFSSLTEVDSRVAREAYLEQLGSLLSVSSDAIREDFKKFRKNRSPAYRAPDDKPKNEDQSSDRLTIVEDDLLSIVLHDDRLASLLANALDLSWVDSRTVSGRMLSKILSEILAEGASLTRSQIEELLETDAERSNYHRLVTQNFNWNEPDLVLRLGRQCLSVLFLRHLKCEEDKVLAQLESDEPGSSKMQALSSRLRSLRKQRSCPPQLI